MSIHINDVLEYLHFHPICQEADGMDTLLEMLHDIYTSHNAINSDGIRERFRAIRSLLSFLPKEDFDQLFSLVCDLCLENEVLAFSQGVCVGLRLMSEIDTLP